MKYIKCIHFKLSLLFRYTGLNNRGVFCSEPFVSFDPLNKSGVTSLLNRLDSKTADDPPRDRLDRDVISCWLNNRACLSGFGGPLGFGGTSD